MGDGSTTDQGGDGTLLATVVRLVSERGMGALTLEDIAAGTGVSPEELRERFPTEADAICACVRQDEDRFLGEIVERTSGAAPEERLRAIVEGCVIEYDWTLWVELWSMSLREPWAADLRAELDAAFRREVLGLIRAGQATGAFAVADAERAAVIVSALLDGFATEATFGDSRVSPHYMHRACLWTIDRLLGSHLSRSIGG